MPSAAYPERSSYYVNVTQQWIEGIQRDVPGATSADKAYAWGREQGIEAPRWAWRDAWRSEVRAKGYRQIYERFDEEEIIPRSWMQSTEYRYGTPYTYIVKTGTVIDEDGKTQDAMVTVMADVQLSIGEVLEDAANLAWSCWPTVDPFDYTPTIEHAFYKPEHLRFP